MMPSGVCYSTMISQGAAALLCFDSPAAKQSYLTTHRQELVLTFKGFCYNAFRLDLLERLSTHTSWQLMFFYGPSPQWWGGENGPEGGFLWDRAVSYSRIYVLQDGLFVFVKNGLEILKFSPGPDLNKCIEYGNFIFAHLYQEQKGQLGDLIVSV